MKRFLHWLFFHPKPMGLNDNCIYWVCECGDRVPGRKSKGVRW